MDILRLLSRSTKQSGQNGSQKGGAVAKLPSSGTSANPQLYHDPIPESRGKKRKRGGKFKDDDETAEQGDKDLDFFSSEPAAQKSKKNTSTSDTPKPAQSIASEPEALLDEGECRQILKSHRLKVTLLPGAKPQKKIKKSKKSKSSSEATSSKEIKQLYPQPLMSFGDLRTTYKISSRLSENLSEQGYKIPTEVQMGSLPLLLKPSVALSGSSVDTDELSSTLDLLAVAPTGSGKTLAFLIPVINEIVQRRRTSDKNHDLEAVIIAPTKELASQIVNEGKKLSIGTGVKILGMKKGMKIIPSADTEEKQQSGDDEDDESVDGTTSASQPLTKTDILVTTPLIFLHALSLGSSDDHAPLPTVRTLVFDEADVLLDPLFREQTLGIWNSCINPGLRVTLWSATMGSNIETLASATIQARQEKLGLEKHSNLVRLVVGLKDSAIPNITHRLIYAATEPGKLIALRQLLRPTAKTTDGTEALRPPFLVFTQTIPRAIALHAELLYDIPAEAGGSTRIAVLHSDLSDSVRDHVMTRFRNGEIWILITTDILSRGVDFKGINGVVNYDVPNSGAAYIHRVGRTGRAGRDGGIAVTFYTKEDIPYVKNVANIIAASEKQAGKPASESSMQKWLLDALPTPSKEEKKKLKKYGVEARRGGLSNSKDGKDSKSGKSKSRMQISTKSGYERKLENNRKGAIQGSKRRKQENAAEGVEGVERVDDDGWEGIDD